MSFVLKHEQSCRYVSREDQENTDRERKYTDRLLDAHIYKNLEAVRPYRRQGETLMDVPFWFHERPARLRIEPDRPWQLYTSMCCVVGKFRTEEACRRAYEALLADWPNLPCNLSQWDKHHLLKED